MDQPPMDHFSNGFAQHEGNDATVTDFQLFSGQNSNEIAYDNNAAQLPMDAASNSLPIVNGNILSVRETVPLYNVDTENGNHSSMQSPSFSPNYYFPVDDLMQQPSLFASSPSLDWQGTATGDQIGQYSSHSAMFNPQGYHSVPIPPTDLIGSQQPFPGNELMNGNLSMPVVSQFNSQNHSSMLAGSPMTGTAALDPMCTSTMFPGSPMAGTTALNPMSTSTVIPATYASTTNSGPAPSFITPGRRVTFASDMAAGNIDQGFEDTFIFGAAQSPPIQSTPTGTFMAEALWQDDPGVPGLAIDFQQGSSSMQGTNQEMMNEEANFNRLYDPRFVEIGLPVDPHLRMFTQHPEFGANGSESLRNDSTV